jgi:hypothetical protein
MLLLLLQCILRTLLFMCAPCGLLAWLIAFEAYTQLTNSHNSSIHCCSSALCSSLCVLPAY